MSAELDAEKRVVAWYLVLRMSDPRSCPLGSEHFRADPRHRLWWRAAAERRGEWTPFDIGMSPEQIAAYSDIVVSAQQVPVLERRIAESWVLWHLRDAATMLLEDVKSGQLDNPDDAIARLRQAVGEAEAGRLVRAKTHAVVADDVIAGWIDKLRDPQRERTIPLPLYRLQRDLGGWVRGKFHVIGGKSSHHKTTLARQSAWFAAKHRFKVLFWTMEDSAQDIAARTIAHEVRELDTSSLVIGKWPERLTMDRVNEVAGKCKAHQCTPEAERLRYLEQPCPTLSQVLGTVRAEAAQGVDMVVLDYVQLVQHDRGRDRDADFWRQVSSNLARLAKELDCVVIATSQIDKPNTQHADDGKPPRASAMLYGGALLQDAFAVVMTHVKLDGMRRVLNVSVEKWKSGTTGAYELDVDAAHDTIIDQQARLQ